MFRRSEKQKLGGPEILYLRCLAGKGDPSAPSVRAHLDPAHPSMRSHWALCEVTQETSSIFSRTHHCVRGTRWASSTDCPIASVDSLSCCDYELHESGSSDV